MNDQERAVMQKALEALDEIWSLGFRSTGDRHKDAITALRAALAQQEQEQAEPVLVVEQEPDYMSRGHFYEGSKPFIDPTEVWKLPIGTKLYTAPPRREWQGLTEEEIEVIEWHGSPFQFARAIEAKLKEKNA